jgi:hypothetical protein
MRKWQKVQKVRKGESKENEGKGGKIERGKTKGEKDVTRSERREDKERKLFD